MSFQTGVLDDFNRANEGPPPSASWSNLTGIGESGSTGLLVIDNAAALQGSGFRRAGSYWNVSDFGPNCECYVSLGVAPPEDLALFLRLINIGAGTTDGYDLLIDAAVSPDAWNIHRIDNGSGTSIVSATQNVANGDRVGFRADGANLQGWHFTAGDWQMILNANDSTYTAAGKIGMSIAESAQTTRLDYFGGGTIPVPTLFRTQSNLRW